MDKIDDIIKKLKAEDDRKQADELKFQEEQKAKKEAKQKLRDQFANHYNKDLVKKLREIRTKLKDEVEVKLEFPPVINVPKLPSDAVEAILNLDISKYNASAHNLRIVYRLNEEDQKPQIIGSLQYKAHNFPDKKVYHEAGSELELDPAEFEKHISKAIAAAASLK